MPGIKLDELPRSIRVVVPDYFGDGYGEGDDRQWIKRSQRIGRDDIAELAGLEGLLTKKNAFKAACEKLSGAIVDWNLASEGGEPLPKPYGDPKAFAQLADDNWQLFQWVAEVLFTPLSVLVTPPKA